jgi:hypothetical protein
MGVDGGILYLLSGKWRWRVVSTGRDEELDLVALSDASNKMRVRLPFSWRMLTDEEFRELARTPDVRMWRDRENTLWRVSAVGPGTPWELPIHSRHLVFDSPQAWAGIVPFDHDRQLGDLTDDELMEARQRAREFGGARKTLRVV